MTTDVELLPLPSVLLNWPHPTNHAAIRDYARANIAHATAPLQAEIEALKVEVAAQRTRADAMAGEAINHEARAERLAEALQWYVDNDDTIDGQEGNELWLAGRDRARAMLRDQEKWK